MSKMRKIVGNELNVIEYGCAAHQIKSCRKRFSTLGYSFQSHRSCKVVLKSQILTSEIGDTIGKLVLKIYTLPPSSAGVERVFSTLGYVHSDIRNRLGQEKAAKLAFTLRALRTDRSTF